MTIFTHGFPSITRGAVAALPRVRTGPPSRTIISTTCSRAPSVIPSPLVALPSLLAPQKHLRVTGRGECWRACQSALHRAECPLARP